MRGFAAGALCNAAVVVVGFLAIGVLTGVVIRSDIVAVEQIGDDGRILWLSVVTFVLNAVLAAGAAFAHVRLTPRRVLGDFPAVLAAAVLTTGINALLSVPYLAGTGEWTHGAWLIALAALGAVAGATLAARTRR